MLAYMKIRFWYYHTFITCVGNFSARFSKFFKKNITITVHYRRPFAYFTNNIATLKNHSQLFNVSNIVQSVFSWGILCQESRIQWCFLGFPRGCVWAGSGSAQTPVSCLQLVSWLPDRQQLTPLRTHARCSRAPNWNFPATPSLNLKTCERDTCRANSWKI